MKENYGELRERHLRELRSLLEDALREYGSINAASAGLEMNVGTLWRLCKRLGLEANNS